MLVKCLSALSGWDGYGEEHLSQAALWTRGRPVKLTGGCFQMDKRRPFF